VHGKRSKQAQGNQKEKASERHMKIYPAVPKEVIQKLNDMVADPEMVTLDAYSPDTENYPDGRIPFVDQHLRYLRMHKQVDPDQYLSNLELMIKKR
jgi:hypothetical protein